ncbi:Flp family type IVb pilin [Variovorax sp. J22G73]|jgi:pilus assembly protein Flp/PilA|uniref:Flp family type IVb pilin n=1 Tax=unclassified Variovorax TaxID=663243 RepID=UPI000E32D30C|nr:MULTISPECIES: Flp family type IVb pilin [unclassified Variovorax]MDM0006997.1 Flp family type IVb pilin [Variovorax sp. J22R203]MDM0099251.1 Flp family type IVb pilin [Variovorax sp. J22G73]
MLSSITRFLRDEEGATAIEYGIIAGLVSVAIVTILSTLGTDLNTIFTTISTEVAKAK